MTPKLCNLGDRTLFDSPDKYYNIYNFRITSLQSNAPMARLGHNDGKNTPTKYTRLLEDLIKAVSSLVFFTK